VIESNPEIGYYQAVVDDQRVALERSHETIEKQRNELDSLRAIAQTVFLYLGASDGRNDYDADDLLLDLNTMIDNYVAVWGKKVAS